MQQNIPVCYSCLDFTCLDYFKCSINQVGSEKIEMQEEKVTEQFVVDGGVDAMQKYTADAQRTKYICKNLPAVKDGEPYLYCPDDYKTQIVFEVREINFPWKRMDLTTTWESVDKSLRGFENFGRNLNLKNPFKDDFKLKETANMQDKVLQIFSFVKERVVWDGKYRFYCDNVSKTIKEGSGSNAAINFILMAMLKDAGIKAFPIMMSLRSQGMMTLSVPNTYALSTFIIGVIEEDGRTWHYIDGSMQDGYFDVLNPNLLVRKARVLIPEEYHNYGLPEWVDLSGIGKNTTTGQLSGQINLNGEIQGNASFLYMGIDRVEQIDDYKKQKEEYPEKMGEKEALRLKKFKEMTLMDVLLKNIHGKSKRKGGRQTKFL